MKKKIIQASSNLQFPGAAHIETFLVWTKVEDHSIKSTVLKKLPKTRTVNHKRRLKRTMQRALQTGQRNNLTGRVLETYVVLAGSKYYDSVTIKPKQDGALGTN